MVENSFSDSRGCVMRHYPQCHVTTLPKAYRGSLSLCPSSVPRPHRSLVSCWLSHVQKCQTLKMTRFNTYSEPPSLHFALNLDHETLGAVLKPLCEKNKLWFQNTRKILSVLTVHAQSMYGSFFGSFIKIKQEKIIIRCFFSLFVLKLNLQG